MWGMFENFASSDAIQIVLRRSGDAVGAIYKDDEREVVSQSLQRKEHTDDQKSTIAH